MLSKEEIVLLVYVVAVLLFLGAFVVVFFVAFQRRKNKLLLERLEEMQRLEKELANTQLEIQEQTLKNIAWELHDNVGQLLSVANIQLNMLMSSDAKDIHKELKETKDVISATVQEVRSLSKTLNSDVIQNNGLVKSIKVELERFNRLNFLYADFKMEGEEVKINSENEIIIFRILQEFFSNVIKHAKADNLFVLLSYKEHALEIIAEDNGVGFDTSAKSESSGMHNMKNRAKLLDAEFSLTSTPNKGTKIFLSYPIKK